MSETDHSVFYDIVEKLWKTGQECAPRGLRCKELTNFSYTLPPRVRFMCFDHRKLNLDYVKQEFLWYLRADHKDVSISKLAKMWGGLINADGTINSNYGWYLFHPDSANGVTPNFMRAAKTLVKDPDSRRAVACILDNRHLNSDTQDYPCTSYLNWHIRDNRLVQYVRMRSQDAIFGMGNDAPCFSLVHELMWAVLKPHHPDLELGDYHHLADSFHVYERHYEMVKKILVNPVVAVDHHESCPPMDGSGLQYAELRAAAENPVTQPGNKQLHPFTRWLLTRDDQRTLLEVEHR